MTINNDGSCCCPHATPDCGLEVHVCTPHPVQGCRRQHSTHSRCVCGTLSTLGTHSTAQHTQHTLSTPVKMTAAEASVAWPQSGTSTAGVNQRSLKMLAVLKWSGPAVLGSTCAIDPSHHPQSTEDMVKTTGQSLTAPQRCCQTLTHQPQ